MIEHITYNEGLKMLQECQRVLKPGKIRISTPNLQVHLNLLREKNANPAAVYGLDKQELVAARGIAYDNAEFVLNLIMHGWGHKFVYDFKP